jgi:hypothetical protein
MEVLRFDSSAPDASCRRWVEQLSSRLGQVSVVLSQEPAESQYAPPLLPVTWQSLPVLERVA